MVYITSLPYMNAVARKAYLPKEVIIPDPEHPGKTKKLQPGHGNLAFIMATTPAEVIHVATNTKNCSADGKYRYLYHNIRYHGTIGGRTYNVRDSVGKKDLYDRIHSSSLHEHPPMLLNKTPDYNTFFDLSMYLKVFDQCTVNQQPKKKVSLFWAYLYSIINGEQCSQYPQKFVLVDVDLFDNFGTNFTQNIDNILFKFYYSILNEVPSFKKLDIDFYFYSDSYILRVNPSKMTKVNASQFRTALNRVFKKSTRWDEVSDTKAVKDEEQREVIKATLSTRYNLTGNNTTPVVQKELPPEAASTIKVSNEPAAKKNPVTVKDTSSKKKVVVSKPITNTQGSKTSYIGNDIARKAEVEIAKDTINKKINQKVEETTKEIEAVSAGKDPTESKAAVDYIKAKSEMDLDNDKELVESMYKVMQATTVPSKPISTARDAQMRKKQESITLENMTFQDVKAMNAAKRPVPKKDISSSLHTINDNMKTVKFSNVNKDYIENVMPADLMNDFTCLNKKGMPFYVIDIKSEDTSDELNYKMTMKVTLEDEKHQRHVVTVDIPKFLDDKFLYLGGNKKLINKQNFLYPVVKTGPDTVQIVSNYNKIFVRRTGAKSISAVERLMKLITSNENAMKHFTVGNVYVTNKQYLTTLEYDEFSKVIRKFETPTCTIFFSQEDAQKYVEDHDLEAPKTNDGSMIFIGWRDKNKEIWINSETQSASDGESICDILVDQLPPDIRNEYLKTRNTKKVMYSTATMMSQTMPLIVYMLYWEGITSVFKKMNLKYEFSKSYPKQVRASQGVIRFKDCYMLYDADMATALLMNGMKVLDTESHDINEYNSAEAYVDYFKKVYGKVAIMSAISNYYEFMIDPITEEILRDIGLPTDLIELCIYANSLLVDDSYTFESSQRIARVRSSEVIPAILYYQISNAYLDYKNSGGKKKLTLPRNCVIKELMSLQTVEDYSTLNPVVELEKDRTITAKGYRGVNVDRAYSEEKRSYDPSMIGVISMSTSPDGNCGINRTLTMEPNITSARGYVDIKENQREDLKDVNLFSPAELLYPLGNTRDDSVRIAMAVKQSKHVIPVQNASPALISNGSDEAIRFDLSTDFVVNAAEDGKVIDYDPKSNILMVEYKSGKHQAINLAPNIVKNGGGGFYLSNELVTKYKVGDSFKKDAALAWHKDFFKEDKLNGLRMNVGVLEKVAIISSYNTYNDCTVITRKLAADAQANMTFCKSVVVGKNSNVYDMRKVGDHVHIGDPLLSYDTSFEDSDLNKLLATLSDENKELMENESKNVVRSKYAGTIVGIKIYSAVELDEMSPSLRKVVNDYYKTVKEKKGFLDKYAEENSSIVKCGLLVNETTGKIEPNIYGVIKGQKVEDSVLIEFYIEHGDILGVGDKVAYSNNNAVGYVTH